MLGTHKGFDKKFLDQEMVQTVMLQVLTNNEGFKLKKPILFSYYNLLIWLDMGQLSFMKKVDKSC